MRGGFLSILPPERATASVLRVFRPIERIQGYQQLGYIPHVSSEIEAARLVTMRFKDLTYVRFEFLHFCTSPSTSYTNTHAINTSPPTLTYNLQCQLNYQWNTLLLS